MQDAIAFFAVRLTAGIGLMLLLMPRRDVTSEFFRILLLVCLGLGVVAALTSQGGALLPIVWCIAAFLGSIFWLLERRPLGTAALVAVTGLALGEAVRGAERLSQETSAGFWPLLASTAATIGTLGGAMAGMLLGHRYLTSPGMPLAPLQRINDSLGLAGLLRLAVSGATLWFCGPPPLLGAPGTWLALRWIAGISGPLVVCVMVREILRYRNTQSATGVLFVGVILTFLGELAGDLLLRTTHSTY